MNEKEITAKYGQPGENLDNCNLPFAMKLAWAPKVEIKQFKCHVLVKSNLESIFKDTLAYYGPVAVSNLGLDKFGGCFNIRPMRGGTKPSVHSWGLAVDIDPERNQLKWGHDIAQLAKPEYETFWQIVEKYGGISLGKTKNYDWMHFQFIPIGD